MRPASRPVLLICACLLATAANAEIKKRDTIKSLEKKTYEVRPGKVIVNSTEMARENYEAFLDLVSDDPVLRAEAMRRLGDLQLEETERQQLADNVEAIDVSGYRDAVQLFQQLLDVYPDYQRNDTVLYQLARAYEISGQTDDALRVLNELVGKYPDTLIIDEVQFRRGEMLFLRKMYEDAEAAYRAVVSHGEESRFYEQSLYKLGWSQFKLGSHEDSLDPFFELLDRKVAGIELKDGDDRLEALSRAERELVEDTFRVLSISFSYMEGADSIDAYLGKRGYPEYGYVIYMNLGDLYLEKERCGGDLRSLCRGGSLPSEVAAVAGRGYRGIQARRISHAGSRGQAAIRRTIRHGQPVLAAQSSGREQQRCSAPESKPDRPRPVLSCRGAKKRQA
jgi:TolA-binding protein